MSVVQFSQREKTIFVFLLAVCAVYGLYMGLYLPSKAGKEDLQRQLAHARKQLLEQNRDIELGHELSQRMSSQLEAFKPSGTPQQVVSGMLSEIEAAQSGVKVYVTEMKPQGVKHGESFDTFSVSLTMNGQLGQLLKYIYLLQAAPHHLMIDDVHLDRYDQNTDLILAKVVVYRLLAAAKEGG